MAGVKGDTWKNWGIYDMIILSTIEISLNLNILFPLIGFWSTSLNTFVFPWGMLTPTLLDVAAILGLPAGGKEVHAGSNFSTKNLAYESDSAFIYLLNWNFKTSGDVTDAENKTFLMYFFNKYFYNNNSFQVVNNTHPFIHLLLSNQGYSWGSFTLSLLYKVFSTSLRRCMTTGAMRKPRGLSGFFNCGCNCTSHNSH